LYFWSEFQCGLNGQDTSKRLSYNVVSQKLDQNIVAFHTSAHCANNQTPFIWSITSKQYSKCIKGSVHGGPLSHKQKAKHIPGLIK